MGESLGTGATIALKDAYGRPLPEKQRYASAAMVNNLVDLEKLLTYLKPPTWPEDVLGLVIGKAMTLAGAGVVLGLLASWAATRVMSSLLYGVQARDPVVFAAAPVILIAVAALASYIPARRASRVDPLVALRME